jgi:Flp pilus assembly protein protease CpaA
VASFPLSALRGAYPSQRQSSPHLLCAARRAVQELQGTHIRALPRCGGDYRASVRGGGLRVRGEPNSAPRAGPYLTALISLAVIDLEHRLLPNAIVGPAALAGLVLSILANPAGWWTYPLSAIAVAGALLGLALIYPSGMGMGDVKMGGMLGAFLGTYAALAVFLGALIGAVTGGLLMAAGKMQRRSALPFGLFMALGGMISLFAGPQLWELYMNLVWG